MWPPTADPEGHKPALGPVPHLTQMVIILGILKPLKCLKQH